jgi:cytochrome P450
MLLGDPYPVYAALRAEAPVYFSERYGFWALTGYDDVRAAQRDWETFSTADGVDIDDTGAEYGSGDFLEEDPPRHDVLRAAVREHFVPKRLRAELTEPIRAEVRRLLADLREMGSVDLARDLAWPLPVAVGSMLLGIPSADHELLLGLQRRLAERLPGTREVPADAREAAAALRSHFGALIESRRSRPRADIVTAIATAEPDGLPIGDDAIGMLFLLFVASMETTASSIGNALFLLAHHEDQRRWLGDNAAATERAVEEVLRFEAPVQVTKRVAKRDVKIHDVEIERGGELFMVLASANRDERRYDRAEEFDLQREPLRHLAFGDGIHHCLGAPLARLELCIVLEELLQSGLSYELDGQPKRLPSHFIRGFSELPARVS